MPLLYGPTLLLFIVWYTILNYWSDWLSYILMVKHLQWFISWTTGNNSPENAIQCELLHTPYIFICTYKYCSPFLHKWFFFQMLLNIFASGLDYVLCTLYKFYIFSRISHSLLHKTVVSDICDFVCKQVATSIHGIPLIQHNVKQCARLHQTYYK